MSEVPKRGRESPKGSKNKPGTVGVGCPRKDGRPPQPRQRHSEDSVSSALMPVPSTHVPSSVPAASTSSEATPKTFTASLSANEGLTRPHQFTVSVLTDSPSTGDVLPGGLSPRETSSRTSSNPSLPTHLSSQSPALSRLQPRGETCPAPHDGDGPIHLVQSALFTVTVHPRQRVQGVQQAQQQTKCVQAPSVKVLSQMYHSAMLKSTPDTPPLSCATDTLGVSICSLSKSPSPSPSPALPPAGSNEGMMLQLLFSPLQLLEDGDEDFNFQLITVTEPMQSACRMTAPTAAMSELSLSRLVSPPHNTQSSSPTHTTPLWSRQPVNNPYGSDINASGAVGDDEEKGEDEVPELEREFAPWNDEDVPDGKQTGVRGTPDGGDAGGNPDIRDSGQPHSSMPTWLKNDYLCVCERLVKEMAQNTSQMPTCYDRQIFYDGAENCFLAAQLSYDGSAAGIFHQPQYSVVAPPSG
ncbi:hypothetical protein BDN67DRAFT_1014190 [Paxillus ammoniavirescens]|nr:hypothetical protein BDN67DRAFT_1014190 [Paxillus ammoniavirescens]